MTVSHWLHPETQSKTLALPNLVGTERDSVRGDLVRAAETIREAVLPMDIKITWVDSSIRLDGNIVAIHIASQILEKYLASVAEGRKLAIDRETAEQAVEHALKYDLALALEGLPKFLTATSLSQFAFMQEAVGSGKQLVLSLGPTGTGKTHLAIAAALHHLALGRVKRVILTRPHVFEEDEVVTAQLRRELEADCQYDYFDDILIELIGQAKMAELKRKRQIEVMPFGRLRGRTMSHAFIVLDEAQNASIAKMRMALTRIGDGAKMVVTGDPSNPELLGDEESGLVDLLNLLEGTDFASLCTFTLADIVRNGIVAQIEALYAMRAFKNLNAHEASTASGRTA